MVRLAPQERAALVLRDVFAFSIEDVAQVLTTSEGAVKAALHRGRGTGPRGHDRSRRCRIVGGSG